MKQTKFLAMLFMAFAVAFSACTNVDDPDDPKDEDKELTVLYGENFGVNLTTTAPTTGWPAAASYTEYLKGGKGGAAVVYAAEGGAVTIRGNQPSSGYTAASGSGNAMMAATGASLIIKNIATCGATNLKLSFGSVVAASTINLSYRISGQTEWVAVPYVKETTAWGLVENVEIKLPTGTNTINLKFTAGVTEFGSRIDDIKITTEDKTGDPVVDQDNTGGTGGTASGAGTEASPYNVAAAMINQASPTAWVKGYIVGSVKNVETISTIASADDVVFGATNVRNTVVLLADSKTETDYTKCVAVNLPSGAIRTAVNLQDNPANLGKELTVNGVLRTYFGIPGVRDLISHKLEGQSTEPPVTTDPNPVTSLTENFETFTHGTGAAYMSTQTNSKGWKGVKIQGTLEGDVRQFNNNKYVQFSAHRSSGVTAGAVQEFWLISPRLDLTNATNKMLSFETAAAFFNATTEFEVYVLDSDNPATANKVKLEGWRKALATDLASGQTYTPFIPSGNIDLSAQTGIKRIGFYYKGTSGSGSSATYQLDNFKFGN